MAYYNNASKARSSAALLDNINVICNRVEKSGG